MRFCVNTFWPPRECHGNRRRALIDGGAARIVCAVSRSLRSRARGLRTRTHQMMALTMAFR
jgi:hypothetical protein